MPGLSLDQFLSAGTDLERAQYHILGGLQKVRSAFSHNIIYPHLGELVRLYESLKTIVDRLDGLRNALPGTLIGLDMEKQELRYDRSHEGLGQMGLIEDLIHWGLPLIQEAIEEGRTIFEFVEENLRIEEVGLVPSYTEEGYLLVPDPQARHLHIIQYSLSIFTRADERFRSLRTTHVKSLPLPGISLSPQSIKLDLLAERRELPNPATYFVDLDHRLDFPYAPTVLPIAKRKLMRRLYQAGGAA